MSAFNISAVEAGRRQRTQGYVGELSGLSRLALFDCVINDEPAVAQAGTVVVATATDDHAYVVTINSVDVTFTAGTATTKILIAAGLVAAINAEPLVRGVVSAATDGVDTVTVTSLYPGTAFTLTDADAKLTTTEASTANDDADAIEFGRLVVSTEYATDSANRTGGVARSTAFSAQVDSYLCTYDDGIDITVEIVMEGKSYKATVAQATSLDASLAALVVELNAVLPANTVIASDTPGTATTLVLTSELAGKPFTSSVSFGAGRDTGAAVLTSTAGIATDVTLAAVGISKRDVTQPSVTVGSMATAYPARSTVTCIRDSGDAGVWVANTQTITIQTPVYVELDGTGTSAGKFYNTTSSTRALLPAARWLRDERSSPGTDGIALLSLHLS